MRAAVLFLLCLFYVLAHADHREHPDPEVRRPRHLDPTRAERVTPYSLMDPHPIAEVGPWFEGYYTRVVDAKNGVSFATITTSYLETDEVFVANKDLKAYGALFFQGAGAKTPPLVVEAFPQDSYFTSAGSTNISDRTRIEATDFEWVSDSLGRLSQDSAELRFDTDVGPLFLNMRFQKPEHWDGQSANSGPEGAIAYIDEIPLHWYVYSLASEVSYEIVFPDGRVLKGAGLAHREKNWGKVFPKAWMWVQATDETSGRSLALAGGQVDLPVVRYFDSFLLGYRSKDVNISFNPTTALISIVNNDSCRGEFELKAEDFIHEIRIKAEAPPESFGLLSIPTRQGYEPGAIESFKAEIKVEVFKKSLFKKPELIETQKFKNSALEFGADYYNESCDSRH